MTTLLLIVALVLVAGAAVAGECKPIEARIEPGIYLPDGCMYDGDYYPYCGVNPIHGTLNGTWYYYGVDMNYVTADPGAPYSSLWAGWGLDVLATNRGQIYAQENWMFNLSAADAGSIAGFPLVTLSNITGGTEAYEGATGWFGVILDDAGDWGGFMKGEVCTP